MRVPSTKMQNNFGSYLNRVDVYEEIIITKNGKDVAMLVSCNKPGIYGVRDSLANYELDPIGYVAYEEFLKMCEESDLRHELIDGVVYNLASPVFNHQLAIQKILGDLIKWFEGKSCIPLTSPLDIKLKKGENNINVVQPDIVVICDPNNVTKDGKYQGTPSLVVEVLSPSTRNKDMIKKLELYQLSGVSEYWIIDLKTNLIHVYQFQNKGIVDNMTYMLGVHEHIKSFHFEGLKVGVKGIFNRSF